MRRLRRRRCGVSCGCHGPDVVLRSLCVSVRRRSVCECGVVLCAAGRRFPVGLCCRAVVPRTGVQPGDVTATLLGPHVTAADLPRPTGIPGGCPASRTDGGIGLRG